MKTLILFSLILFFSCKNEEKNDSKILKPNEDSLKNINHSKTSKSNIHEGINDANDYKKIDLTPSKSDTLKTVNKAPEAIEDYVNLKNLSDDFIYDIKYATADNFLKQAVYDCPECYLKKTTALALIKANEVFKEKGYKILIYDCYRPLDVQKKMWAIMPGTNYVANPKKGSKHNRGAAVDLTLIDKNGQIVDMGTPFDFFGKEAHHTYQNLPKDILANRKLLRETLNAANFRHISSEWWHYEYRPDMYKPVSNFKWNCE